MTIAALPEATVHLLGSAQVLTTPTSLIKELIDNSLDARATSVDILISSNTLDKLEVRDNGHGVPQEHLDALGRRGYTSKLRSFEELKFLGGVTLGFRGEAVASAVQLGEVTVATKTEGELVGTKVKLKAPGGIEQQTRTSHPVGTTVTVLNFMSKLPVRKKTFEKEAAKTLVKVNQLLRAYALARPGVKFSLKVTKGGKGSWSYAPRPNGDIRGAVSQVIGKDAAMQCVEKFLVFPEILHSEHRQGDEERIEDSILGTCDVTASHSQREQFTIEAFLPIPQADPSKLGNGQYLSIDSRPVSHEKGTMKKVVTLFKQYIRGSLTEATDKIKNPFIRLNIKCPVASYDANVEPAKDDVLFGNESLVLKSVERLFKNVYGECKAEPALPTRRRLAEKLDNFELLLARKPPLTPSSSLLPNDSPASIQRAGASMPDPNPISSTSPIRLAAGGQNTMDEIEGGSVEEAGSAGRKWRFDMSTDYREEVEGFERPSCNNKYPTSGGGIEPEPNPKNVINPWVIARLNAPVSRNMESSVESHLACKMTFDTPPGHVSSTDFDFPSSPTPRPRQTFRSDDIRALQVSRPSLSGSQGLNIEYPHATIDRRPFSSRFDDDLPVANARQENISGRTNDFTASNLPRPFPMSPPSTLASKRARVSRGHNRPFVSTVRSTENRAATDNLVQARLFFQSSSSHPPQQSHSSSDLAWAMDFEHRKEDATRQRREEIRNARLAKEQSHPTDVTRSSPHKNRYNAAIASLEIEPAPRVIIPGKSEVFKTTLLDEDPRAYLMRRQKSMASHPMRPDDSPKMMRAKSRKLPMERIPRDGELFRLVRILPTNMGKLGMVITAVLKHDAYISRGSQAAGLVLSSTDAPGVIQRLQKVVEAWANSDERKACEIEFNFSNLLSR